MAAAIGLSTRQPVSRVWHRNFFWSAPSYLAGAALAALATAAPSRGWFGWLALLAVPLYLVFRSYHTVVARLREEQNETRRAMDVQLATIEALALAIEARAGLYPDHIRSIQQYAAHARGSRRAVRRGRAGGAYGRAAARHRQHGGPRAHPVEARGADARGIRSREDPPARRRRDSEERAVRRAGQRSGVEPSRAVGWPRLSRWPARQRHPARRARARHRRLLQHAAGGSPLSARPQRGRSDRAASGICGLSVRSRAGRTPDRAADMSRQAPPRPASPTRPGTRRRSSMRCRTLPARTARSRRSTRSRRRSGAAWASRMRWRSSRKKSAGSSRSSRARCSSATTPTATSCRYAHGPGTEALFKWEPKSWSEISLRLPSCADGRGAHGEELTSLLPCPLRFDGRLIGGLVIYHSVAELLHRRAPADSRPRERTGRGRHLQLDAVRADAARIAHRSAHRAARTGDRWTGSSRPAWHMRRAARHQSAWSCSTSIG